MTRRRWLIGAVTILAAVALLPAELSTQARELRIVSYNIRHGRGEDKVVDLERTARVLRELRPDIVGFQEVDERAERSGSVAQAERLGELLGMQHAFGKFMDFQGGAYGMAVLSRHPIVAVNPVRLPDGNEPRVALTVDIRLPDDSLLTVINVHFDWVRDDGFRYAQAETLARHLDGLKGQYVLLGDFNDVPESRTLALFRARAAEASKPSGARFTFPSDAPAREIDYIFFAPRSAWRATEVRVIDERVASDHRPVLAVLQRP